jgi:hypothetical protein
VTEQYLAWLMAAATRLGGSLGGSSGGGSGGGGDLGYGHGYGGGGDLGYGHGYGSPTGTMGEGLACISGYGLGSDDGSGCGAGAGESYSSRFGGDGGFDGGFGSGDIVMIDLGDGVVLHGPDDARRHLETQRLLAEWGVDTIDHAIAAERLARLARI